MKSRPLHGISKSNMCLLVPAVRGTLLYGTCEGNGRWLRWRTEVVPVRLQGREARGRDLQWEAEGA